MANRPTRARRRPRYLLLGIGLVLLGLLAVPALLLARFDPGSMAPILAERIRAATGRSVTLGAIHLKPSLWPTVAITDLALANPPGFSRPQMLTLQEVDAELALLPLFARRIEIARVVFVHPDLLLETDAEGHGNWVADRKAAPSGQPGGARSGTDAGWGRFATMQVAIASLVIEDGRIGWHQASGRTEVVELHELDAKAANEAAPISIAASGLWRVTPFTLSGELGSLARLQDRQAAAPWPVRLDLAAATLHLGLAGGFSRPDRGQGYDLKLT